MSHGCKGSCCKGGGCSIKNMFKCAIIEESLADTSILKTIENHKFTEYYSSGNDDGYPVWCITGYLFTEEKLLEVMDLLKNIIEPEWYAHAFNEQKDILYVVLKGRVFKLPCIRENGKWDEMINYGQSIGIERKWTENIPLRI